MNEGSTLQLPTDVSNVRTILDYQQLVKARKNCLLSIFRVFKQTQHSKFMYFLKVIQPNRKRCGREKSDPLTEAEIYSGRYQQKTIERIRPTFS
jgi:hypothetical protein